jgi:4'-phosphopantetheinyl transferase
MKQKEQFTKNNADKEGIAFQLSANEVHIWCSSLERPLPIAEKFSLLLSPDEKARAERFYFERDRVHFIVGRGLLRTILGSYLGMDPAQIEFSYGLYGKPALQTNHTDNVLQFNLAHSKDLAVYAFCWNHQIGIDLEHVRPMPDEDNFAEQFFSARESALIASLSGEEKRNAFFKIWTCKEAFLKASGDGLTKPIDQAEISLHAETARLLSLDTDHKQALDWNLEMFRPLADYQAALAIEGRDYQIVFRQVDDEFVFE